MAACRKNYQRRQRRRRKIAKRAIAAAMRSAPVGNRSPDYFEAVFLSAHAGRRTSRLRYTVLPRLRYWRTAHQLVRQAHAAAADVTLPDLSPQQMVDIFVGAVLVSARAAVSSRLELRVPRHVADRCCAS